jgi:hypothetical protein
MIKMQTSDGVTQVTVDGTNYQADANGYVVVPESSALKLQDIGFKFAPIRIVLNEDDAKVIAAAANALNLPVPDGITVVPASPVDAPVPDAPSSRVVVE